MSKHYEYLRQPLLGANGELLGPDGKPLLGPNGELLGADGQEKIYYFSFKIRKKENSFVLAFEV